MSQQPDTTTTTARELARELRMFPPMLQDSTPYDAATTRGVIVQFVQRNGITIAATLDALADENARLAKLNHQHLADLADEDDQMRELCKRVLPPDVVDGDSYMVPGVVELCEMMVNENARLRKLISTMRYYSNKDAYNSMPEDVRADIEARS